MSKESEAQLPDRIRSKSENPKEPLSGNHSRNSFKFTGQLILDSHRLTRNLELPLDNESNTLQNLKNPMGISKVTKLGEFVQLPPLRFEQHTLPSQQPFFSQEAISPYHTPPKPIYAQTSPLLDERQQSSVIMESHQKLSESRRQKADAEWNMERLQMALDYVQLEEIDSPVPVRAAKRKLRRQADKQQSEREQKERALKQERERVRRERERNMEMVSGFLSGKATFMWLFILGNNIRDQEMGPVREIYKSYMENDYEVPICKGYDEALRFLRIESCFFKVVCDLDSCQQVLTQSEYNKNIIAVYIYNPQKEKGVGRAFQLKRSSRKVRGMLMDLADAAYIAQEEIQNQAKFIRVGHELERQRNRLRFPGFFILNGIDSTEVTSYRMCLYGSLSLNDRKERALYLKEFTDMVEMRYSNSQAELRNLDEYRAINHLSPPDHSKHHEVMAFYVRETFYYALLNAMLRLSRNAEEFRPCVIPFNQTYLAVKHYYKRALDQNQKRENFIAYRGAKLRRSDVNALKVGSFIQLLGFTSTSLKKEQAKKFMDNDSYLIEIEVQGGSVGRTDEQLDYDHGFVDINREGLAAAAFEVQEQVLFNALNVYRVTKLDLESAVRTITLRYGAIVQLVRAKRPLDNVEAAVFQNYRHCVTSFKLIEDDGDALRLAQEHDQCVSYYKAKVDAGEGGAKNLGKLAGAQLQIGDIDAAYDNAVRSLALIQEEANRSSTAALSPSYRVPLELNSRVFYELQDALLFERSTDLYLLAVGSGEWEEQSKVLCVRAEKKLQMGAYGGAISDIKLALETLQKQAESFDKRRSELKRKYFWNYFCCLCANRQAQMEEAREIQLLRIQHDQLLFQSQAETTRKLKLRMEVIMKNVNLKIGNLYEYQECLRRIQEGFKSIASPPATPVEFARRQVLQAATVDTQRNFAEYEHLMEEAIQDLRAEAPMHPEIADYNEMLGFKRYQAIQQSLSVPKEGATGQTGSSGRFDYEGHKLMYRKCRDSLMEAAEHLTFHKGATHRRTMAVNNQLATLDYDFSLLKQAEERVRPAIKLQAGGSEGAQCHVLLAKIALAKGELRRASTHIEKATCTLKEWVVKGMDPDYDRVLMHHPIFLEISMLRAKVYNRQQKHDLALKELQMLQRLVKLHKPFNVTLLANLEEEQAEILVCLGETHDFEACVLRSVRLREQAMGRFNIPNAISFSNLFKYLRYTQDFDNALRYHQRSTEIFSRFPPDHPNAWVMHLSNGLIFFHRKQPALALTQLELGLRIAERRYSPSHINFMKIQLQFAKLLKAMGHLQRSLRLLETLDEIVSRNIHESALATRIENEKDDEKISVRRSVLTEMKELYERSRNEKNIVRTMLGLERCEVNLRQCQEFIADSEKIDSLKSLT